MLITKGFFIMCESNDNTNQRLNTFKELLPCIGNLYFRTYDSSWNLPVGTPEEYFENEEFLFYRFFQSCGFQERISEYALTQDAPYTLGTYNGLSWYVVLEKNNRTLEHVHLLGPVLHAPLDTE